MRMRSPSIAPPENGLEGSTATTPTDLPRRVNSPISSLTSVDLPAPGAPGDAEHVRAAQVRMDPLHDRTADLGFILDRRNRPRDRAVLAAQNAGHDSSERSLIGSPDTFLGRYAGPA